MPDFSPPMPLAPDLKSLWMLDPAVTFLNHGSFGSVPREVHDAYVDWQRRIEANPIEILGRRSVEILAEARAAVGEFLGMKPANFGFVSNATEGINAILRSLPLGPGDELLTTSHVYGAVRQAMEFVAERGGATYREVGVPTPIRSEADILRPLIEAMSSRTRLVVVDHVTSPTALVFPVGQIARECAARGIDLMIDGAHAPAMVELNVESLGAAYYAGNLHKWVCAPKGSAFVWVRPDLQTKVHPLVISHYWGEGFEKEFAWQGTRDFAAWFAVPAALAFLNRFGLAEMRRHNHAMARWAQQRLVERWGSAALSPLDGSFLGSMCTVCLPESLSRLSDAEVPAFQNRLFREHRVEAPIFNWQGRTAVRPCAQIYTTTADIDRLGDVIESEARR